VSGKRDEPEHVHDPDEEKQGGDVREPAPDRLRRQPLLCDLHLRDLVHLLADRLAAADVLVGGHLPAEQAEPEEDGQHGAEHQIHDSLRDREVEAADMDRDPLVLLELGRRVELAARPGRRREGESDDREKNDVAPAVHRLTGSLP
jgi:hypothetical protein